MSWLRKNIQKKHFWFKNSNDSYLMIILDTFFKKHYNHLNIYLEIMYFPVVEVK